MSAAFEEKRIQREFRTIEVMIDDYCRVRHASTGALCEACSGLVEYARRRLERCPFGEQKPTCLNCPIHCYQPKVRDQIKDVMRFAGPRIVLRHPLLAMWHWVYGWREGPRQGGPASGPESGPR